MQMPKDIGIAFVFICLLFTTLILINLFIFRPANINDKIFALIREMAGDEKTVKVSDVLDKCASKGYKPDQVDSCIEEYEELNVWQVNQTRTKLTFI